MNARSDEHLPSAAGVEFWFEFASPYTYVAAMQIESSCRAARVPLVWRPFLLGPIFALQGWNDSHFNLNERRGRYMWRDMQRLTTKLGLPWRQPTVFPRATTAAARLACDGAGEPWIGEFVRRVFVANFGEDRDIADAAWLESVLDDLGVDGRAIRERADAPERRAKLRASTERAIELGIFGSPNFLVAGELFWGEESLEDAIAWARAPGHREFVAE